MRKHCLNHCKYCVTTKDENGKFVYRCKKGHKVNGKGSKAACYKPRMIGFAIDLLVSAVLPMER